MALEFAVVSVPFLVLAFGTMEIGYDYFVQAELDNAVNRAARSVQVGVSKFTDPNNPLGGSSWVASSVCPNLGGMLNCNSLYVAVTPITTADYYQWLLANPPSLAFVSGTGGGNSTPNPVNTGTGCQKMLLQAYYLGPSFLGTLVPGFASNFTPKGGSSHLIHVSYSASGFINENFDGSVGC